MGSPEAVTHFARLLRGLKNRSGRSYADLSRRSLTSRSALHRYCSGQVLPPDVETVARIADSCDADEHEKRTLISAWLTATQEQDASDEPEATESAEEEQDAQASQPAETTDDAPAPTAAPANEQPSPAPSADPSPTADSRLRPTADSRRRAAARPRRAIAAAVMAASAGVVIACPASAPRAVAPLGGTPRKSAPIAGTNWTSHPRAVRPTMFGVTVNSDTGMLPTFKVGSVRFWDSGTRWASLEPRRGEFDWAPLDRQMQAAERGGLDTLFVLGGTPAWAARSAPAMPYTDGSRAAAPDDLRDWDRFVAALAGRYRGRIDAYELWVMGNDRHYFNGTPDRLVELTRRASRIVRRTDSDATVVCPGMGRLWQPAGRRVLQRFAELGGYRYCDAASIKLHQRRTTDPPETMLEPLRAVDRAMHKGGVHPPLWSTGTTYDIPLQEPLSDSKAVDHAMRFYLTGLIGSEFYLRRMYFYNWGSTQLPIVLQEPGGPPTKAALAIERLQQWLAHTRVRSCGHGTTAGLPENVWQCEFVLDERAHVGAVIRWTDTGTADTTAPRGSTLVEQINGSKRAVRPGDTVPVSERPILIKTSRPG